MSYGQYGFSSSTMNEGGDSHYPVESGIDERSELLPPINGGGRDGDGGGGGGGGDSAGHHDNARDGGSKKKASLGVSIFNLSNTMIGGGTVAMASAMKYSGFGMGLILLLLLGFFCDISLYLLVLCAKLSGRRTYAAVGEAAFGRAGIIGVQWVEFINTIGVLSSYMLVIGEMATCENCLVHIDLKIWVAIIAVAVITPLNMLKSLRALGWVSFISLGCLLYMGGVVYVRGGFDPQEVPVGQACDLKPFHWSADIFFSLPIISLGYVCHINFYHIFRELHNPTVRRLRLMTRTSVVTSGFFYALVGYFGYSHFCQFTKPDILANFAHNDWPAQVGRLAMMMQFIFSYPMLCYPCRHALDAILFPRRAYSYRRFVIEGLGVVVVTYLIGVFVPNVNDIFSFTGAVTATALAFVMPSLFYVRLAYLHRSGAVQRGIAASIQRQQFLDAGGVVSSDKGGAKDDFSYASRMVMADVDTSVMTFRNNFMAWVILTAGTFFGVGATGVILYQFATGLGPS